MHHRHHHAPAATLMVRRPIDVGEAPDDTAWCSCGKRIWGADRTEFARAWYEHLASMVHADPYGDHALEVIGL